ncbi:hypothetical protein FACS1894199_15940 [Bacteroidia bacterium]|nr:hypothetical protein FACS1894199_15940 [Bacteroidia bacterium]
MKQLSRTKVTVRTRKAEFRNEWYLCVETYPVFVQGKSKPQRNIESLNRTVSTIIWDKTRPCHLDIDGNKNYKAKRDDNGVILCRSEKDQQACLYADGVRKLRQRECDNTELYSDTEIEYAEQKQRSQQNFIIYFEETAKKRHLNSSPSIIKSWQRTLYYLKQFTGDTLLFSQINTRLAEDFREFMLTAPCVHKSDPIARNTSTTYFSVFKAALKQAFIDGYLTIDLSAKIKNIPKQETRREFLTVEELNALVATPCKNG